MKKIIVATSLGLKMNGQLWFKNPFAIFRKILQMIINKKEEIKKKNKSNITKNRIVSISSLINLKLCLFNAKARFVNFQTYLKLGY